MGVGGGDRAGNLKIGWRRASGWRKRRWNLATFKNQVSDSGDYCQSRPLLTVFIQKETGGKRKKAKYSSTSVSLVLPFPD